MNAMLCVEEYLKIAGLNQDEIDELICMFLEQEAFTYIECIKEFGNTKERNSILKRKTRDA